MNPSTDQEARHQALDIHRSFIVRAPAGSGKTQLLTLRFLALLSQVQRDPEEILAITFTRKAVSEMRERVLLALINAAENAPLLDDPLSKLTHKLAAQVLLRNQQENWCLLENPHRLRIQTIDAFCAYLTTQMSFSDDSIAGFQVMQDASSLYLQAARATLNEMDQQEDWSFAVAHLFTHLDNSYSRMEGLLVSLLAKRDQWLPYLKIHQSPDRVALEQGFAAVISDHLRQLVEVFPLSYRAALLPILTYVASQKSLVGWGDRQTFPTSHCNDCEAWIVIAELLLTKSGSFRKTVTIREGFPAGGDETAKAMKAAMQALLNELAQEDTLRELLHEVLYLPPLHYTDEQWQLLTTGLKILPILLAHLHVLFQRDGVVDYVEVSLKAQEALGEVDAPSDLNLALDQHIRHILVDEFQDTSLTQWHLLEKITAGWQPHEGRTLFLVGDPMQSIYRFRKAEVGLFLSAATQGINQLPLTYLTLQTNFRSTANLVNAVSELFGYIVPPYENVAMGAVKFVASLPNKLHDSNSALHWHPLINVDEFYAAHETVNLIQRIFDQDNTAQIAILVGARSHAQPILPLLREKKISYQALDIEPLAQNSVVMDLLALTRALIDPLDRVAWLAVLRAPWCGLTLADLTEIGCVEKLSIWERILQAEKLPLSPMAQKRLSYFVKIMQYHLSLRAHLSLSQNVETLWQKLQGHLCSKEGTKLPQSEAFFDLLNSCEVAADLANLTELERRLKNQYTSETFNGNSSPVEIMTIHKAKGLEFDYVILPSLERRKPPEDTELFLFSDYESYHQKNYLLVAPIKKSEGEADPTYCYLQRQAAKKSEHERLRLFYVAATRAKKNLHLFGIAYYQNGWQIPAKQSFLGQVWNNVMPIFQSALEKKVGTLPQYIAKKHEPSPLRRLKDHYFDTIKFDTLNLFYEGNHIWWDRLDHTFASQIGIVIHKQLQYWSLDSSLANVSEKAIKQNLLELGMSQRDKDNATLIVLEALKNIQHCEQARWIFDSKHQAIQTEYPLNYIVENQLKTAILDRTFIDEKGTRWIVDFKIHLRSMSDRESFLSEAKQRHHAQLNHYAKLMYQLDDRPVRLGLYFPLQREWIEIEFCI